MAQENSPITNILDKVKEFYSDENNKTTKIALLLIAGSLLAYTVYSYNGNPTKLTIDDNDDEKIEEPVAIEYKNDQQEQKESQEEIQRKKAAKAAAKKKAKEIKKIEETIISESKLIVNNTGWNIRYFMSFMGKKANKKAYEQVIRFKCASCGNICRDCVEIEDSNDDRKDEDDPIIMSESCAKKENKKYKVNKTLRKMILKEMVILPDFHEQELIQDYMKLKIDENSEEDVWSKMDENKNVFTEKMYLGTLSKFLNKELTKIAEKEYKKKLRDEELEKIRAKVGEIQDLDWKFHDDSQTKQPLFLISDDGKTATSNKRSGTVLYGPFITTIKYEGGGKWVENYSFFGNVYRIELKISDADGCGVGFCSNSFNQFVGKNEGHVNALMLNQTGWFYTSRIFKHKWEHSRESPMGKWFKSNDIIVIIIDCTDCYNVKGQIYNKNNEENKFEIEKLPKQISIGVNLIVGSNPTGTVEPAATIVSATVVRKK